MPRVRWGVLGTGSIARTVVDAAPGAFVAAASRDAGRARAFGLAHSFGSYGELVDGPADAVAQATAYEAMQRSAVSGQPVSLAE